MERTTTGTNWLGLTEYSEAFASAALDRFRAHEERLRTSKRHSRMLRSWQMYYKYGAGGACDDTEINTAGSDQEILVIHSSRYRRNIQDYLALVMQTPPEPTPMAINSDPESEAQSMLCRGVLDWYRRVGHLEDMRVERAEVAAVFGESYAHARWDPDLGEEKRAPAVEGDDVVHEGDFVFSVRSPYEVATDPTSPDKRRPRWAIVMEPANRFDLIAQFGADGREVERAILNAQSWSERLSEWDFDLEAAYPHDDTIPAYWVYAERSRALPNGRKALVVSDKIVLLDGPLAEERIGLFRCSPSEVIMRPEGHTNNFHALGLQQAHSGHMSMILSNLDAFGMTRIVTPIEGNVEPRQLSKNLGFLDYRSYDAATGREIREPHMLQGSQTSPELFRGAEMVGSEMDIAQGGSPTLRGDPEATKGNSGAKDALLLASAQNVSSGGVQAVLRSDEELFSFIISSLRRHASLERMTRLAGTSNTYAAEEFIAPRDLANITRVLVERPQAALNTFAGRMDFAQLLAATPEDQHERLTSLVTTGRIETQIQDVEHSRISRERENKALRSVEDPVPNVMPGDPHLVHIEDHNLCSQSYEVRVNPALHQRFAQHMLAHMNALTMGSPGYAGDQLLLATQQKPLGHIDPTTGLFEPGMPGGEGGQGPKRGPGAGAQPPKPAMPERPATPPGTLAVSLPQMPVNPSTGEREQPPGPAQLPEPTL